MVAQLSPHITVSLSIPFLSPSFHFQETERNLLSSILWEMWAEFSASSRSIQEANDDL